MFKKLKIIFLLSVSAFLSAYSDAQDLNDNTYLSDFNILVNSLQELHPNLYTNISKDAFDTEVANISQRLLITNSRTEAIYIIQELMYKLGNSHAGNISVYDHQDVSKVLPFSVYIIDHDLYIKNYAADTTLNGLKINAIENTPTPELIDSLKIFFATDGNNTAISYHLQPLFNGLYGMFCCQKDTFTVNTEKGIMKFPAALKGSKTFDDIVTNNSEAYFGKERFLKKVIADDYGYLKFVGFVPEYKGYKIEDGYNAFIKEANAKKLKAIVIDLRYNSGGDPYLTGRMTSYLTDHPFKVFERVWITQIGVPTNLKYMSQHKYYRMRIIKSRNQGQLRDVVRFEKGTKTTLPSPERFKGKIYIITGSITQSASTMMCSYLKGQSNVTFVGSEPIGSINYFWANSTCDIKLPALQTTFAFGMEMIELKRDCSRKECPESLIPDHVITYTIQDLLQKKDKEMEFIMSDLKK